MSADDLELDLDLDALVVVKCVGKDKAPQSAAAVASACAPNASSQANATADEDVCVPGTRLVPDWCPPVRQRRGARAAQRAPTDADSDSSDGDEGFPPCVRTIHRDIELIKGQFPST